MLKKKMIYKWHCEFANAYITINEKEMCQPRFKNNQCENLI